MLEFAIALITSRTCPQTVEATAEGLSHTIDGARTKNPSALPLRGPPVTPELCIRRNVSDEGTSMDHVLSNDFHRWPRRTHADCIAAPRAKRINDDVHRHNLLTIIGRRYDKLAHQDQCTNYLCWSDTILKCELSTYIPTVLNAPSTLNSYTLNTVIAIAHCKLPWELSSTLTSDEVWAEWGRHGCVHVYNTHS